jgi:hypothetical protein
MSDTAGDWSGQPPPYQEPIPNNLVWAILSTLFCCLPLGIVSIVYAAQVSSKQALGDIAGARQASDNARKWAIASAIAFVVVMILYILAIVGFGMFAGFSDQF